MNTLTQSHQYPHYSFDPADPAVDYANYSSTYHEMMLTASNHQRENDYESKANQNAAKSAYDWRKIGESAMVREENTTVNPKRMECAQRTHMSQSDRATWRIGELLAWKGPQGMYQAQYFAKTRFHPALRDVYTRGNPETLGVLRNSSKIP